MRPLLLACMLVASLACGGSPSTPAATPATAPEEPDEAPPPSDIGEDAPPAEDEAPVEEAGKCDSACYEHCMAVIDDADDCMVDCC